MATTKVKGSNFRAFINGAAAVEATSCQVSIQGNMEDARTKDSEGSYAQEQMTSKGWSVQVDSLEATAAALKAIITMFNSDTPVTVGWDQTETTAGTQNRTAANAAFARSGLAILNDFSISASNRANVQVSRQFQGTGALA
jgi:hypothetical protein